jgi:hypothetical protein
MAQPADGASNGAQPKNGAAKAALGARKGSCHTRQEGFAGYDKESHCQEAARVKKPWSKWRRNNCPSERQAGVLVSRFAFSLARLALQHQPHFKIVVSKYFSCL